MVLDEIDTCIIGSKKEVKYLAYFVTKSNGFEKGSEVLGLLCHKEQWYLITVWSFWLTFSLKYGAEIWLSKVSDII